MEIVDIRDYCFVICFSSRFNWLASLKMAVCEVLSKIFVPIIKKISGNNQLPWLISFFNVFGDVIEIKEITPKKLFLRKGR